MFEKKLDQITRLDLENLLAEKRSEGRSLDYKRDLPSAKDEDRRELARDVSSLANGAGGDLVYGIEEAKDAAGKNLGIPEALLGVECENFDALKLRIENMVRDLVDPRVQGLGFWKVEGFDRGPIIIVRVPKSWIAPHMVSFQSQTHFYSRNNAGRQPLDVREIKAAILAGTDRGARVRKFRDERIARIVSDETPVPLRDGARVVVHIVPLAEVEYEGLDLLAHKDALQRLPPVASAGGWDHRFNLDGFVTFSGPAKPEKQRAYSQVFRDGSIEGVSAGYRFEGKKNDEIFALGIERDVTAGLDSYFRFLKTANDGPVSVMVTLVGVGGARIQMSSGYSDPWESNVTIDRDLLVLPDVVITDLSSDPRSVLRSTFDALWQSSGWERSFGYDNAGNWDLLKHR